MPHHFWEISSRYQFSHHFGFKIVQSFVSVRTQINSSYFYMRSDLTLFLPWWDQYKSNHASEYETSIHLITSRSMTYNQNRLRRPCRCDGNSFLGFIGRIISKRSSTGTSSLSSSSSSSSFCFFTSLSHASSRTACT